MPELYMIAPGRDHLIATTLAERPGARASLDDDGFIPLARAQGDGTRRWFALDTRGIAVIQISGLLLKNWPFLSSPYDVTGYPAIEFQVRAAEADPDVRGVLLVVDSPGGVVAGCFDLADAIRGVRMTKPVWAVADEEAYSAAYALASQADALIVTRTGGAGSIGVRAMHVDMSAMMEQYGIKVTSIFAGAHKDDGTPYAPLAEDVAARWQAGVEETRQLFAETVALGRGDRCPAARALETEAQCLTASEALDLGLADAIMAARDVPAAFAAALDARDGATPKTGGASATRQRRGPAMRMSRLLPIGAKKSRRMEGTEPEDETLEDMPPEDDADPEEDETAEGEEGEPDGDEPPEDDEDDEAAPEPSASAAVLRERKRATAIMSLQGAAANPSLATWCIDNGLDVKQAKACFAASGADAPAKPQGGGLGLSAVMPRNPDVGADGGVRGESVEDLTRYSRFARKRGK